MRLTPEYISAVSSGDLLLVKIMLKDAMLVDPSLKAFNEMVAYAENRMPELYDQHDGEFLNSDPSAWNKDYMNHQMVSVVSNFSKERIELLKKIVQKIYAHRIKPETKAVVCNQKSNKALSNRTSSKGGTSGVQIAGVVIAVAGAGVLVAGVSKWVGGAALIGGIAMAALGSNKRRSN